MTFGQQILATLIGTVSGFLLSIVLFWIKEKWATCKTNSFVVKNAQAELDIGISILEKAKNEISKAIEKVTVQDSSVFVNINYSRMARMFLIQFYNSGLMIKKLTVDEINKLNNIYINFAEGSEAHLIKTLDSYSKGETTPKAALNSLTYERELIQESITDLTNFRKKIGQ